MHHFNFLLPKLAIHLLLFCYLLLFSACPQKKTKVLISTELGDIVLLLDNKNAPITTANFLKYTIENRWEGASFYRTVRLDNQPNNEVKIEVIQGGLSAIGKHPNNLQPIALEPTATTGIKHQHGTISMARDAPNSATAEFFICINEQSALDFGGQRNPDGQGFAAFGKVIKGMDIVLKIQAQTDVEQSLVEPVKITAVKILR